jgi:hypothetical protein
MILGLVLLEAVFLLVLHRRTGRGIGPSSMVTLLAGAFLLLAVRFALSGEMFGMMASLACAGLAHVADLRVRWERP